MATPEIKNTQIRTGTDIGDVVEVIDVGSSVPGFPSIDGSQVLNLSTTNLAQNGATDGDAIVWNNSTTQWEPQAVGDVTGPASTEVTEIATFSTTDGTGIQGSSGVNIDSDGNIFDFGINVETRAADFTVSSTDKGKNLECASGGAFTITIPANSTEALPVGFTLTVVQADSNSITFSPASGVTLQSKDGLTSTSGQWTAATIYKSDTDTWVIIGDLS